MVWDRPDPPLLGSHAETPGSTCGECPHRKLLPMGALLGARFQAALPASIHTNRVAQPLPPAPSSQDLIDSSRNQWLLLLSICLVRRERDAALGHSTGLRSGSGKYKGGWRGSCCTKVFFYLNIENALR